MRVDELIHTERNGTTTHDLANLIGSLHLHGFIDVHVNSFQRGPDDWAYVLTGKRPLGDIAWIGHGKTEDEAAEAAVDSLAKWILNQSKTP